MAIDNASDALIRPPPYRLSIDSESFESSNPAESTRFARSQKIRTLRELLSLNATEDVFNLEERNRCFSDLPSKELLYIADGDGDGFLIGISGDHRNEVWRQNISDSRPEGSNPRVLWHDRRDMRKLADSFDEFLSKLGPLSP